MRYLHDYFYTWRAALLEARRTARVTGQRQRLRHRPHPVHGVHPVWIITPIVSEPPC